MPSVVPVRARTTKAQLRSGLCLIALLAIGCGSSAPTTIIPSSRSQHVDPTGMRVVSMLRPTPGVVRVSLWIDAGSRDADPPQLATISAWTAAGAAGPDTQARALPDAIEIWVECKADEIESAIQRLARALATRDVDQPQLVTLRERLVEQRARQEIDGVSRAEQVALAAALGDAQAATFFPFGTADQDDQLTRDRVAGFLGDHFGPNRAALIAVGDVRASLLSAAIGTHVARLPQARAVAATRTLDVSSDATQARVDQARHSAAAIAVIGADHRAVAATLATLHQRWSAHSARTHWVPVRGGAIGVMVAQMPDPLRAVVAALEQPSEPIANALIGEGLAALSERAGLELCAPPIENPASTLRWGVAATLAEPARSGPEDERRTQARVETLQRDLQDAVDSAARTPSYRGEVGTQAAHVVLRNGARIVVQRRQSEQIGIAFSFLGGASEEHHTGHGRTALLALLSAQACEGLGAGALSARLRSLGATLSPVLSANAFGLQISAPRDQWRASLELVTRCALRPLLNRRLLRDAQARMLDSLTASSPHGRSAEVARVLSPSHPGNIALWGSVDSALLDLDVITRAHAQAAVGSRMAIAIVGDVPVEDAVNAAAKPLAKQPAGALPQAPVTSAQAPTVSAASNDGPTPVATVAFRIATPEADRVGSRVFAALLAEALTPSSAITLTWLDAGQFPEGAWAAVGLALPLESLEPLHDTVTKALHQMATPAGRARAQRLLERAIQQEMRLQSEPVHEAEALVTRALIGGAHADARTDRAAHTFDTFVRAHPHYLVSRGNTARSSNDAAASRP